MKNFRPIREKHAIEEVAFLVLFKQPVNFTVSQIAQISNLLDKISWKAEKNPTYTLIVNASNGAESASQRPSGFIVQSKPPSDNDAPTWLLQVTEDRCVFVCRKYEGWTATKQEGVNALFKVLSYLQDSAGVLSGEVQVQFKDVFVYQGSNPEAQEKNELLSESSQYLPAFIFETGSLWHQFQGWIDILNVKDYFKTSSPSQESFKCIHNLNLTGTKNESDGVYLTTATHIVRCLVGECILSIPTENDFDNLLGFAHDENKKLVKSIFSDLALQDIGLK